MDTKSIAVSAEQLPMRPLNYMSFGPGDRLQAVFQGRAVGDGYIVNVPERQEGSLRHVLRELTIPKVKG